MIRALEKLYPLAPVWAQNVGIAVWGLGWRNERLGGDFDKHVDAFRERDRWRPAQMRDYVEAELRRVLLRAFAHTAHYRRVWSEAGITAGDLERMTVEDLPNLPITTKQALRAEPGAFIADDYAGRRDMRRYCTCGTTGTPIAVTHPPDIHRRFFAAREVRSFGWAGTSIRRPRSMMGARLVVPRSASAPPFHRWNAAERQVYFSGFHIAPQNVRHYVDAFNHYRPEVLTGYIHSHYLLARTMQAGGFCLGYEPVAAVLGSENLTFEMREVMQRAFRTRVFEEYGAAENCVLATECEQGRLHVSPDFGVCEIVDERGRPLPAEQEGRVLCTGLLNDAQPLIRYDIGDSAAWSAERCPCGRDHLPVLREIIGRQEDAVVARDGRQMVRCVSVFKDLPGLIEGQIIQEHIGRFTVLVVTEDGFGETQEAAIRHRFELRLGQVDVGIERVPAIPRTEKGKFRAVVNRIPLEERAAE
jgi:phenylacetate-CoA ligase